MTAGLFRPVIVLPAELPSAISRPQLRDVLMHEIAHIERLDNLIVLLQAIAKTVFWPIVFVHLLSRQLARAREDICDNHVLACRDAVSYGETLLRLGQLACGVAMPIGTVGILQWRGKLEERIFGLIHEGRSKMTRMHPLMAVGVLILFLSASALLCATTIVAARGGEQEQAAEGVEITQNKVAFKFDEPVQINARSKPIKDGNNELSIIGIGRGTFHLDNGSRLKATLSASVIQDFKVDSWIHASIFDGKGNLLGTAAHKEQTKGFRMTTYLAALRQIELDFGVSDGYRQAVYVVIAISESNP